MSSGLIVAALAGSEARAGSPAAAVLSSASRLVWRSLSERHLHESATPLASASAERRATPRRAASTVSRVGRGAPI